MLTEDRLRTLLRVAESAHAAYETELGTRDEDWPTWYAQFIVAQKSRSAFDVIRRYAVADAATWAQPVLSGKRILIRDVSAVTMWSVD